jgi:GT2 family glycosyltransferase
MNGLEKWPFISVVIVSFNGAKLLENCIDSLLMTDYPSFEVILVDNASTDGSIENVLTKHGNNSALRVFRNKVNLGFAKGNNIGVQYAKGDYIAFINQDTLVNAQWLKKAIRVIEANPAVGMLQFKVLKMDNPRIIDCTGVRMNCIGLVIPRGGGEIDNGQYDSGIRIFSTGGSAMLIRKELFVKAGGFDSDFFLLFEETDLCWRIRLLGYDIIFAPDAIVYHKGATTRSALDLAINLYYIYRNRLISMIKNYSLKNLIIYLPLHLLILLLRTFIGANKKKKTVAYLKALRYTVQNLRKTFVKRVKIQSMRVISDKELFRYGLIENISTIFLRRGL